MTHITHGAPSALTRMWQARKQLAIAGVAGGAIADGTWRYTQADSTKGKVIGGSLLAAGGLYGAKLGIGVLRQGGRASGTAGMALAALGVLAVTPTAFAFGASQKPSPEAVADPSMSAEIITPEEAAEVNEFVEVPADAAAEAAPDEASAEQAPAEEAPVEAAPADEAAVEEAPAEDGSAAEPPAETAQPQDAPAVEQPVADADDQVAAEQPVAESGEPAAVEEAAPAEPSPQPPAPAAEQSSPEPAPAEAAPAPAPEQPAPAGPAAPAAPQPQDSGQAGGGQREPKSGSPASSAPAGTPPGGKPKRAPEPAADRPSSAPPTPAAASPAAPAEPAPKLPVPVPVPKVAREAVTGLRDKVATEITRPAEPTTRVAVRDNGDVEIVRAERKHTSVWRAALSFWFG